MSNWKISEYAETYGKIRFISPEFYLSKAPLPAGLFSLESVKHIYPILKNDEPFSAPCLVIRKGVYGELYVSDHEGRHRTFSAGLLGDKKIPCIFYLEDGVTEQELDLALKYPNLLRQQFDPTKFLFKPKNR